MLVFIMSLFAFLGNLGGPDLIIVLLDHSRSLRREEIAGAGARDGLGHQGISESERRIQRRAAFRGQDRRSQARSPHADRDRPADRERTGRFDGECRAARAGSGPGAESRQNGSDLIQVGAIDLNRPGGLPANVKRPPVTFDVARTLRHSRGSRPATRPRAFSS